MAPPDLNSVPRSPRTSLYSHSTTMAGQPHTQSNTSSSRRTSTQMLPPPLPRNDSQPTSPRNVSGNAAADNTGVGIGPGPLRHPRPLTAAELHLELEKEQESIVNRLTRELSALRAQTASVASTASSTSDHFFTNDSYTSNVGTGTTIIPTSNRRQRSSSNLSARSARSVRDNLTSATSTSVSAVAAPRDQSVQASSRPSMEIPRPEMSRQNSTSANGYRSTSINASPHMSQNTHTYPHRTSVSSNAAGALGGGLDALGQPVYPRSPSFSSAVAAARYEEAALHKAELEAVKRENEMLRARVKELEKNLTTANTANTTTQASG